MKQSQKSMVLEHLNRGNTITQLDAWLMFKAFRLPQIIKNLRDTGHNIKTTMLHNNGKHFASYRLLPREELF